MTESHPGATRVSHEVTVDAPAEDVYRLLADLANWPWMFRAFVHAEVIGRQGAFERVGMWTTSGDRVEHWLALRRLDEAALRIDFRPEDPAPPLASMERSWVVEPVTAHRCTVRLLHGFTLTVDDPGALEATRGVIDTVADAETSAVRAAAELTAREPELLVVVTDTVPVAASAEAVYDALYDVPDWPGFLPHVARAEALQDEDGLQLVEVDTVENGGGLLTMRTARAGLPHRGIAYKQLRLPPIGSSHTVGWHIEPTGTGVEVTSRQTVVVRREGIARLLGDGKGTAEATAFIQRELSAKVRLILDGVKRHVEGG
ncbi:SRPBCC family protein [Streptomyces sp. NPDC050856]|uniref:aromatase/cyclase n=1 Tax=Streptomyces sp. NPDC050856 TaxID=3154939 RepID=UPI0033C8B23C